MVYKILHIPSGKIGLFRYMKPSKTAIFRTQDEANSWLSMYSRFDVWDRGFILHYTSGATSKDILSHKHEFEIIEINDV